MTGASAPSAAGSTGSVARLRVVDRRAQRRLDACAVRRRAARARRRSTTAPGSSALTSAASTSPSRCARLLDERRAGGVGERLLGASRGRCGRASASPPDHCSTSGAPVPIALPRTPSRGAPSAIRQWLMPVPTLT